MVVYIAERFFIAAMHLRLMHFSRFFRLPAISRQGEASVFRQSSFSLACWALIFSTAICLSAQNTVSGKPDMVPPSIAYKPHLAFDVVSIHEVKNPTSRGINNVPGTGVWTGQAVSLWGLLVTAYDIKIGALIVGVPKWAANLTYDIEAQSDASTDRTLSQLNRDDFEAEKRYMLQRMLADRFHLKAHFEDRTGTTYELLASPETAKLMRPIAKDKVNPGNNCYPRVSRSGEEYQSSGCPFDLLIHQLKQDLGTEVLDRTGITGFYAYRLTYTTRQSASPDASERFPYVTDALREQLGLELKRTRGPVKTLVIDHADPPTPN
ncbi:TIGR03435 family protein [Silvibacterium sp.]|uniref:TIGR03435 family protein n=1 Tax=Silvibacterium sp. TaxID=1964179 RepID=UPI0039E375A5